MFTLAQELRAAANDHFSVIVETVKKNGKEWPLLKNSSLGPKSCWASGLKIT